jgi:antitoxin component of MazEF toxin-antitoxin module
LEIETKKLQKVGDSIAVILPTRWLRRFCLSKGKEVDLVMMNDAILIIDRSTDFNSKSIKAELDLAQKNWDEKADRKEARLLNKLSPEEQAAVRKMREQTTKDLKGKFNDCAYM